jgi:antitoxin HicB
MRYPAKLRKEPESGYTATFPDIPEAITCGTSVEDALLHAKDALESAIDWYLEDGRMVPTPSKPKRRQHLVELPPSYAAKILLLNEMTMQRVRPAELARRMKVTPQEVNRLLNVRHATKIDSIAGALKALGKTMEIRAA